MVWWYQVSDEYDLPMRFQLPRGYSEYGKSPQFNLIVLEIDDENFLHWFRQLEEKLIGPEKRPIDSRVKDNTINVKYVDGFTQVFDSRDAFLLDGVQTFANCNLDCLVEIDKVYGPLGDANSYGITCKIFQVRVSPVETKCLFE